MVKMAQKCTIRMVKMAQKCTMWKAENGYHYETLEEAVFGDACEDFHDVIMVVCGDIVDASGDVNRRAAVARGFKEHGVELSAFLKAISAETVEEIRQQVCEDAASADAYTTFVPPGRKDIVE